MYLKFSTVTKAGFFKKLKAAALLITQIVTVEEAVGFSSPFIFFVFLAASSARLDSQPFSRSLWSNSL